MSAADTTPVTRAEFYDTQRRVLDALRPTESGCVGRPSVDAALAALAALAPPEAQPAPLVHGPEHGCAQPARPLPVPGKDGCPGWARWVAWDDDGACWVYEDEPSKDGGLYHTATLEAPLMRMPRYDSKARAVQCEALVGLHFESIVAPPKAAFSITAPLMPAQASPAPGVDWQARAEKAERERAKACDAQADAHRIAVQAERDILTARALAWAQAERTVEVAHEATARGLRLLAGRYGKGVRRMSDWWPIMALLALVAFGNGDDGGGE